MAIIKMQRLRLIGLNEQRKDILSRLLHLGCVEISELTDKMSSPEWMELLQRDTSLSGDVKSEIGNITAALDGLDKYAPEKNTLFIKRVAITEQAFFNPDSHSHAMKIVDEINENLHCIAKIYSQENKLAAKKASLLPWKGLDIPLDCEGTTYTRFLFGSCPATVNFGQLQQALSATCETTQLFLVSSDEEQHYLLLVAHKLVVEEALASLRPHAFSVAHFKDLTGTAAANLEKLEQNFAQLEQQKSEAISNIIAQVGNRKTLQICLDRANQELSKEQTRERLLTDGTVFFCEGWAPVPEKDKLIKELSTFLCAYDLTEPEEGDLVPTLLKNNKLVEPMNMVTEMYSLPVYRGIDPNPLIFFFYVLFFGMMFADIAYGLIITGASLAIKKIYHPKGTIGYMFGLGVLVGISATIWGVLTGSFFGDAIPVISETFLGKTDVALWSIINPLQDPMTVLIFGIGIGCVHLIFGQCIHIYLAFRDKNGLDGILDVIPWWLFFAGTAVAVITKVTWLLWIGIAGLILTQGRHKKGLIKKLLGGVLSLYDLTSWLGDILSYSRLMALMLASAVIASVVNILGSLNGSLVIFILVFLIGHTFNLGINIIGTYVHAARLQYLEFFSKFYEEGGIPFRPLQYKTKYVDIVEDSAPQVVNHS